MRLFLFLLCLYFINIVHAEKGSSTVADVYKLSPAIYDVKGMGHWQKGSRGGQIRLVITRMEKQDEVFLQWVQWNEKGPEMVKSTIAVKEIKEQGRFKVDFIRRETVGHTRKIVLGLENLYDKTSIRAVIQVEDLGVYRCEFE